jgi:2'-5' RNA ligase
VLVVPVPELEPYVRARTEHYDPAYVSADPAFTHAHVTALGPVRPHLDERTARTIAAVAAGVEPFEVRFDRIDTFPNGIIHLLPEPDGAFRELTGRLVEAFPDCPPYAGEFPDPVPHLTLDLRSAEVTEASTRELLGELVPCTARATRLDLSWYQAGRCHLVTSWPLGSTSAARR